MIDSCIAIQLYLPTPLDIFINQFNRNFSEIDTVLFVSSFLLMILYDQTATASCSSFKPLCQSVQ